MGIEEAEMLLGEAYKYYMMGRELLGKRDFSVSVQAAQSCIELAIKALFNLVDLPYPPLHDPTTRLSKLLTKFELPERYSLIKEDLFRLVWLSKLSKAFHSFSIYGYLDAGTSKIFQNKDAKFLLDYAFEAWNICNRVAAAVRSKQIKIL